MWGAMERCSIAPLYFTEMERNIGVGMGSLGATRPNSPSRPLFTQAELNPMRSFWEIGAEVSDK